MNRALRAALLIAVSAATLYGLGAFSYAKALIDYQRLAGKWDAGAVTLELRSDGTTREHALLRTAKGTFHLLPGNRVEFQTEGLIWGTNTTTFRWKLEDDALHFGADGGDGYFWKLKRLPT